MDQLAAWVSDRADVPGLMMLDLNREERLGLGVLWLIALYSCFFVFGWGFLEFSLGACNRFSCGLPFKQGNA